MPIKPRYPELESSISSDLASVFDDDGDAASLEQVLTSPTPTPAMEPTPAQRSVVTFPRKKTAPAARVAPPATSFEPTGLGPADVSHQMDLTREADETLEELLRIYGKATGLKLSYSEFVRAALYAFQHAKEQHQVEAARIGELRRPKNEPARFHERDSIEKRLGAAMLAAFRSSALMD